MVQAAAPQVAVHDLCLAIPPSGLDLKRVAESFGVWVLQAFLSTLGQPGHPEPLSLQLGLLGRGSLNLPGVVLH